MIVLLFNWRRIDDVAHAISAEERGLQYGDGVFETMLLQDGAVRFFVEHCARLHLGCEKLGITAPAVDVLRSDVSQLASVARDGVIKIVVTRGAGGRGYRASPEIQVTRIASLNALPAGDANSGIAVRWCATRLARNPQLAGIKHLNRLEQVLAQNEWRDDAIAEGLMLDTEGEVISATASNVFLVLEGSLVTPDLRFSGIRGVMRSQVLAMARALKIEVEERAVWPQELQSADEVFLTNAIRGVRPVVKLEAHRWESGSVTQQLAAAVMR